MASEAQAMNAKDKYGANLRHRYGAHAISVARAEDGGYFLQLLVSPGMSESTQAEAVDDVPVRFEESEGFKAFTSG